MQNSEGRRNPKKAMVIIAAKRQWSFSDIISVEAAISLLRCEVEAAVFVIWQSIDDLLIPLKANRIRGLSSFAGISWRRQWCLTADRWDSIVP
jgi:hypothetical protein